jgi:hypothetical protein
MKSLIYRKLFKRAIITWLLFLPVVVLNGAVREAFYKPIVGGLAAHQISTVIAAIAFFTLAYVCLKDHSPMVPNTILYQIGLMWVALTVLFEIILGHVILNASWEKVFSDYNLLTGRVWTLFLLIIFLSPVMVRHFRLLTKQGKYQ